MKRLITPLACIAALFLIAAQQQPSGWLRPYSPTRLEWLALQCNINHPQRYDLVHTIFLAAPPGKIKVVIKLEEQARQADAALRKELANEAENYVRNFAKAHGWDDPLEVEVTEVLR